MVQTAKRINWSQISSTSIMSLWQPWDQGSVLVARRGDFGLQPSIHNLSCRALWSSPEMSRRPKTSADPRSIDGVHIWTPKRTMDQGSVFRGWCSDQPKHLRLLYVSTTDTGLAVSWQADFSGWTFQRHTTQQLIPEPYGLCITTSTRGAEVGFRDQWSTPNI